MIEHFVSMGWLGPFAIVGWVFTVIMGSILFMRVVKIVPWDEVASVLLASAVLCLIVGVLVVSIVSSPVIYAYNKTRPTREVA